MHTKVFTLFIAILFHSKIIVAQNTEVVRSPYIATPMLFQYGNQIGFPVIKLNTADQLELHFDDLQAGFKNYFYTLQLCNADWSTAMVSYFDYIKGFSNNRINTYRISSIAQQKYTHYMAYLPEKNCMPIKSGNYLLKVYTDGDSSRTVFTKRFVVVEDMANIGAQIIQPLTSSFTQVQQQLKVNINLQSINMVNPQQQLKIVVLQNNRWDMAQLISQPTFVRGKDFEYSNANELLFAAGKEWRWADLRSFRFWSDRVLTGVLAKGSTTITLRPDIARNAMRYTFYRDLNGQFQIMNTDNANPYWQGDYATVTFNYQPPNGVSIPNYDVYLMGSLTNYVISDATKMKFNTTSGMYENKQFLKQGFYNYAYALVPNSGKPQPDISQTEGNYWETENTYQVLVYYKPLGARADAVIGYLTINTLNGRNAVGF